MDKNNSISPEENFTSPSEMGQTGFSIPQNYFDELPEKTMNKIHSSSKQKESFFLLKPSITITSLAVLSGIILLLVFSNKETLDMDIVISENELVHVIENPELYNIDENAITEEYLSLNIPDETGIEDLSVSDEEIRSYLEENAEASNIINEY